MIYKSIDYINGKVNLRLFNKLLDKISFLQLDANSRNLISKIRKRNLTYLGTKRLVSIVNTISEINEKDISGDFIEAGCALGGSSVLISKLKKENVAYSIFDVFGIIPAPDSNDTDDVQERYEVITSGESRGIGGDQYYGYQDDLYDKVIFNLRSFDISLEKENIKLVKGEVQKTMNIKSAIAFAHIDVDWYNSTLTCLEQIWPNLVIGGSMIIDDYDSWGGCRKATDEYFSNFKDQFLKDEKYGSLKITRTN